ncbi:MAG: septum formation initiator family protein [Proteobacteria bacterium]|nr:MAG: septum formation initiator family protein [Pseudomonadota bacterium]
MGVRLVYCLAVGVLLIGTLRGENSIFDYFKLRKSSDVLEATVDKLKSSNEDLSDEIRRIKGSPHYARKVLRDKYHVTDGNEKIIFFAE